MKQGFAEEANTPLSAICFIPCGSYLSLFTSHAFLPGCVPSLMVGGNSLALRWMRIMSCSGSPSSLVFLRPVCTR